MFVLKIYGKEDDMKKIFLSVLMVLFLFPLSCNAAANSKSEVSDAKKLITFADVGWDSIKLNNALAGLVAEAVFGYTWQETPGSTPISHEALLKNEVDVHMEEWTDNIPSYASDLKKGKFKELGINFNDNYQGFYIPRYIADRYPDLKTVKDLKKYAKLFPDPQDRSKGIIYGGVTGWSITEIMHKKVKAYGLDGSFNYFESGSDAILSAAMTSAWDKKEPIVAYYWEPTWLLGKYDFVLLKDEPYNPQAFQEGIGACPSVKVTVAVSNKFAAANPEFCVFLSKFRMTSPIISRALAYMNDTGATYRQAATWLLTESHPELVDNWLTPEQSKVLKEKLQPTEVASDVKANATNWLFHFPRILAIDASVIDEVVRSFAVRAESVLDVIKDSLNGMVGFVNRILTGIPWILVLIAVVFLGMKARGTLKKGLIYGFLVFLIGAVGMWELMCVTLSVVITSVFIALLFGIPIGILISGSERANRVLRPVLDTMQTMPVFVYLIPALLLLGTGNASGVVATVVYAIVPVIRLTSLGIQQVDKEVVEAGRSFGSTWWQLLRKVQIPQAMPTIMTGVNQTLMMAMSMVVTTSMIGVRGLGMEVLNAVNRIEIGRGLMAGTCVVILAIVLDRLTQGMSANKKNKERKTMQEGAEKHDVN